MAIHKFTIKRISRRGLKRKLEESDFEEDCISYKRRCLSWRKPEKSADDVLEEKVFSENFDSREIFLKQKRTGAKRKFVKTSVDASKKKENLVKVPVVDGIHKGRDPRKTALGRERIYNQKMNSKELKRNVFEKFNV